MVEYQLTPIIYPIPKTLTPSMNVKIDTKEKFTIVTPIVEALTANMTEELIDMMLPYLQKDIPHIVLNMSQVVNIEQEAAGKIAALQQKFYENNCSFVICELKSTAEEQFDKYNILELLNVTPTESEAWDIVQMEEIEREVLGGEE